VSVQPDTASPPSLETLIEAARALARQGADEPAKRAYLSVLKRDPTSLPALLELARLALRSGHRSAARTAYQQAIFCHPADPTARVNLANLMIEGAEFEAAKAELEAALAAAPLLAAAHQGLARVLTALGASDAAAPHWRAGFAAGALLPQPYAGAGQGIPILLLVGARGGNIPTRALLDDTVFAVTALYADRHDPAEPLPPHAAIFNAIGDADLCASALERACEIVGGTDAPQINPPARVRDTGRVAIARRLAGLSDVVVPQTSAIPRSEVSTTKLYFPMLFRSPGYHTGQHFVRVERAEDLAPAIADLPGDELLAIEPLATRGPDGRHRKYRAMLIGGEVFPLHLAASRHWKVHYFSADMAADPELRAQEAAFLADMPGQIGPRAMRALAAIAAELGLDYAGVDFTMAPDGRLMLFEANAGMVIAPPGPEPIWDYRRAPTQRALGAVKELILGKARSHWR
jgi:hypothetical protein